MSPGFWQIVIVAVLALVLFGGRGKISSVMGDLAKGITSFRKGLREDDTPKAIDADKTIEGEATVKKDA